MLTKPFIIYVICAYGHENILLLKNATDHGYKLVIQFVVFLGMWMKLVNWKHKGSRIYALLVISFHG